MDERPSSSSHTSSAQSYPTTKSVRGSSFPEYAGGFWRREKTRVLFPVEGWPATCTFFAGIEHDEETRGSEVCLAKIDPSYRSGSYSSEPEH